MWQIQDITIHFNIYTTSGIPECEVEVFKTCDESGRTVTHTNRTVYPVDIAKDGTYENVAMQALASALGFELEVRDDEAQE